MAMRVPKWAIALNLVVVVLLAGFAWSLATLRNPLPWPDHGSRIFPASSPQAKAALVELLGQYGIAERFTADSGGIARSVMMDGTIINHSPPAVLEKLGGGGAGLSLVADDPDAAAEAAAAFLRSRGFSAQVIRDIEPGLPVVFVLTDALEGGVLNFRLPAWQMPRPE
ncbi:MAG: hypothetical protein ACXIUO_00040 [Erythrobacter sp.]